MTYIHRDKSGSPRALLATTAMGLLFLVASPVMADETIDLPTLDVKGKDSGYKTDFSDNQKFTAPLLDTAKSVTVIPEEVIQQSAATSLTDALRRTPGITLAMGEGGQPFGDRVIIRGFNSETDTLIDGIRDPGSNSREIFALEQIEIVKGPGSAYSGTGSTGGSINLISKTPKAQNFVAGSVTLGTDDTKRFTADANYVVADGVGLRLNAMYHDADVAGRNDVFENRWGFAPSLTLGLGGPTRLTLDYYHMQSDDMADYGIPYDMATGAPADVDRDNFYGLLNRDFRNVQSDIGTVRIEHDFSDNMRIRNTTRYSVTTNDYIATNPDDSNGNVAFGMVWRNVKSRNSQTKNITNQTDLSGVFMTGAIEHSYSVGIEYSHYTTTNRPYAVDVGPSLPRGTPVCPIYGLGAPYNCTTLANPNPGDPWTGSVAGRPDLSTYKTTTKSAYIFDTLKFSEQWLLNLGVRYDDFKTEQVTAPTANANDGENNSDFFNYQVGLTYKPLPNGSIYAAFGTSSNPSGETGGDGSSNLNANIVSLDPEKNKSYEIGTKWNVLNEKLNVTAAIFRTEKTNARVSVPSGGQELVGEQRVDGFEIGLSGQVTPDWSVFGGYTYLDAELVDDGPSATNDGNRFPNVAKHSISLWTTYRVMEAVTVGGGAQYTSKVYGDTTNFFHVPGYWRFDAMASYDVTPNVTLQLNVQNIGDKRYFDRAYTRHMVTVAPGRVALISANAKF